MTLLGEHQSPQLDDEKERPKDKQDGPPVPQGTMKPDTIEQTDGGKEHFIFLVKGSLHLVHSKLFQFLHVTTEFGTNKNLDPRRGLNL